MNGGHRNVWGLYVCFLRVLLFLKIIPIKRVIYVFSDLQAYFFNVIINVIICEYEKGLYKYFQICEYAFLT